MYKFGTVKELKSVNMVIPEKVYQESLNIATMLDEQIIRCRA